MTTSFIPVVNYSYVLHHVGSICCMGDRSRIPYVYSTMRTAAHQQQLDVTCAVAAREGAAIRHGTALVELDLRHRRPRRHGGPDPAEASKTGPSPSHFHRRPLPRTPCRS
eukprot:6190368-Pleurochrysis_carterae.AAC.3